MSLSKLKQWLQDPTNKKNSLQFVLLFGMLGFVLVFKIIQKSSPISSWIATHWVVSYEDGFISRGLVGTVFSWFVDQVTNRNITITYTLFYLLLVVIFSFVWVYFKDKFNDFGVWLLFLLMTFHPLGLFYFTSFANFGRFDLFLWFLFAISIFVIHKFSYSVWFYVIGFLGIIGTLIHQNFLLFFTPFLVTYYLLRSHLNQNFDIKKLISLFSPLFTFLALQKFSFVRYQSHEQMMEVLNTRHSTNIYNVPIIMEYFSSPIQHLRGNFYHIGRPEIFISLLVGLVLLTPTFYIFYIFWKNFFNSSEIQTQKEIAEQKSQTTFNDGLTQKNISPKTEIGPKKKVFKSQTTETGKQESVIGMWQQRKELFKTWLVQRVNTKNLYILLMFSTFSPLLLSIIALDYFRWISVFVILNFVSILVVALNHENVAKSFWRILVKHQVAILLLIVFYSSLGVMGEIIPYKEMTSTILRLISFNN